MNMEIATKAAQFPEEEYINGIFVAVWLQLTDLENYLFRSGSYLLKKFQILLFEAVFRIRDILVRIRMLIRILGSVPLTNGFECGSGCDCGSVPKSSATLRMQKINFFHIF
jgi:hypothetical protein